MESGRASFLSFYFMAQIEKSAGDVRAPAVEEALRRVLALEPGFAPALSELASHLAARREKLEEALTLATRATELEPESAWTWVNLGVVYLVVGHSDEARDAGLRAEAVATTPPEREAVEELRNMLADFEETVARETVRGRFAELRCRQDGRLDFIVTKAPNEIYVLRVENVNLVELWRNGSPAQADLECGAQEGEVRATFVVLDHDGSNVLGDLKRLELEPGP
jgi:tetratricopeptide (TPR) repeat protein